MTKRHPNIENTEPTRSMTLMALSTSGDNSPPAISYNAQLRKVGIRVVEKRYDMVYI